MTIFRMRVGPYARAFAVPLTLRAKAAMLLRGWRPYEHSPVWHKASGNQRRLEQGEPAIGWRK